MEKMQHGNVNNKNCVEETSEPNVKSDNLTFKESSHVTSHPFTRRDLHNNDKMKPLNNNGDFYNDFGLLESISFNSLLFFLLANLLTGFVNMTMYTIHAPISTSLVVLVGYLMTLCLTVSILHRKGIATKIW